jgi:exoribonuclease-2
LAPGVKVRMGTKALPHAGIGVKSYAWSTSPLRRYTDMVNQWQIIACAPRQARRRWRHPSSPRTPSLFSIISGFDAAYSAYNGYQAGMERFWTLQYLQQQGITELTAAVFKDNLYGGSVLVRADELPLVLPVLGAQGLARGARRACEAGPDRRDHAGRGRHVIERLDAPAAPDAGEDESGEDEPVAGPIAIAVDMSENEAASADNPPS